jgi:hypothetical protein
MSRKVKVVNINQAPAAKPLGVNPMDPWQAKSGIAEASEEELLHRFLNSRGINPNFVSKDTKIAHSKSGEFLKWKNDHEFSEETDQKDMICMDIPLLIRVLEFTREDMKTDIELHNMVERLISMRENVPLDMSHYDDITKKTIKENHIAIAMGNMLDDEGGMVLSQLEQLERAIAMIRSYVGKDYEKQLPAWVQAKITIATDYADTVGTYLSSKNEKVNESVKKPKPSALDRFRKASDERQKKHDDLAKNSGGMTSAIDRLQKHMNKEEVVTEMDTYPHPDSKEGKKLMKAIRDPNAQIGKPQTVKKTIGDTQKMLTKAFKKSLNKEEVELDEVYGPTQLDHDTVKKHLKNIMAIDSDEPTATSAAHAAIKKVSTIGKTSTKSTTRQMLGALIRKHKIPIDQHHRALLNKEAVELDEVLGKDASAGDWIHDFIHSDNPKFAGKSKKERQKMALGAYYGKQNENTLDSLAATEAPCDGANGGETNNRKSQMSKSARMIKALYKRKGMVKEDTYDHEKEDKSVQTYGKKPKFNQTDKKDSFGEKKPDAAAVMTGGTTLTGEKRDEVEIDPMMKNRPGQNQFNKEFGKKGN